MEKSGGIFNPISTGCFGIFRSFRAFPSLGRAAAILIP
jgi:hypothetical protein